MAEQIVLPSDEELAQLTPAQDISLPDDITLPETKGVDEEVVRALPDTLQFAFWDTGVDIPEELAAGLVGAGDMMLDQYHGIKQMMGIDEESMAYEQDQMNKLYASDMGGEAMTGAVIGALAEPLGFLVPGGKSAT